jgi:hypothetical protein
MMTVRQAYNQTLRIWNERAGGREPRITCGFCKQKKRSISCEEGCLLFLSGAIRKRCYDYRAWEC